MITTKCTKTTKKDKNLRLKISNFSTNRTMFLVNLVFLVVKDEVCL
jgi:hypothetical protein